MSARRTRRRGTAAAIALTSSITAGAALLLSACGPTGTGAAEVSPSATRSGTAQGGSKGAGAAPAVPAGQPAALLNGTAHNGLTISDGTRYVVMNGTRVDFGTPVRDLAWAPDGRKAVFIDGDGDLVISGPDGGGRVIVAHNPGGQTWSHPTWQVRRYDPQNQYPAANSIFLTIRAKGVSKLYGVPATAHDGRPQPLGLNAEPTGDTVTPLPQTGNVWPNAGGEYGASVYANTTTGDVFIRDDYLRQQGSALTKGSEPAMSRTDDQDIVFVRSAGGHDHLFLEHSTDSGPTYKDLTPHAATDYTEPAFSPDGRTVAARTPGGVVTVPADGSHAPVKTSGYVGLPVYRAS